MQAPHRSADGTQSVLADVARLRREKGQGLVAPVVAQLALDQRAVLHPGMHRQQLDGGDAQLDQVVDQPRIGQGREGAALVELDIVAQHAQAAQVGLVNHRLRPGDARSAVLAPAEVARGYDGLGHSRRTVTAVERQIALGCADTVAIQRIGPADAAGQPPRVRIDQQLVRVESVPLLGLVRAPDAVAVKLAQAGVGQVAVPDLVGTLGQRQPLGLALAGGIEQAQFDFFRMCGKHREIDPQSIPGGAQRVRRTRQQTIEPRRHLRSSCMFFESGAGHVTEGRAIFAPQSLAADISPKHQSMDKNPGESAPV